MNVETKLSIKFRLNGIDMEKNVPVSWTLLRYLREELGLTGTKCGCEIGECGVCTVLLNGEPVNACLVLMPQIENANIWTIEGVATLGGLTLHPIQKAFVECDAVHCGFCTPGMVMTTIGLLLKNKKPDDTQIRRALAGNLCRCTGYIQIIEAVRLAATMISEKDLKRFIESPSGN
jgi:carbon-monoxide dehydrogenase small subunit